MEQHRLEKCNKLREMGLNPYVNSHIITSTIANILEKYSSSIDKTILIWYTLTVQKKLDKNKTNDIIIVS